ncbi:MAG TPA: hypothetical protein VHQ90_11090 [Thermoanaerobaculia bacterium]|nr:hypothetical protein [Thermoanaerobaculia bacterium]
MSRRACCSPLGSAFALLGLVAASAAFFPQAAQAQAGPFQFHAVTPCRVVDTRNPNGTNGGPSLTQPGTRQRTFQVQGNCGVPSGATAVTINVTIANPAMTGPSGGGFLTVYPSNASLPNVSTINFLNADNALANGAIVPLANQAGDLNVWLGGIGKVDVILDVTGYFQ